MSLEQWWRRWSRPLRWGVGLQLLGQLVVGTPSASAAPPACEQLQRPREIQLLVAEAEDYLAQGSVSDSLDAVERGERMLLCLSDAVAPLDLGGLYRVKGAALVRAGSKTKLSGEEAFRVAFSVYPEQTCDGPGFNNAVKASCETQRQAVEKAAPVPYELFGHHSNALVYLDGVRLKPERKGVFVLEVKPGDHLLQIQGPQGFTSLMVNASSKTPKYDLMPLLGPPPAEVAEAERGSIRLEGLPRDAKVTVDGRDRRDLPLLQQVEPGDHYIKVASPTMGVVGFTVRVEAGKEATATVGFDDEEPPPVARAGGGGGPNVLALSGFGAAGLSALGSGAAFGLSFRSYGLADEAFDTYLKLTDPTEVQAKYAEAATLQTQGNRQQLLGWGLAGVAVLAGGAGTFFLLSGREGEATTAVRVLPFAAGPDGGAGVLLSGRF